MEDALSDRPQGYPVYEGGLIEKRIMLEIIGQQFFNAVTIGSMYTLVGIGFTLFFGVLGLINFAHGEIFMFGAFTALVVSWVAPYLGINNSELVCLLMLLISMGVCALFGAGIERMAYKPLRDKPKLILLITSLAVSIAIREGVKEFFPQGASPHKFFSPYEYYNLKLGSIVIGYTSLLLIATSILLIILMYLLVTKTWLGRAMRAAAEDSDAARMMGIEVDTVIRSAFYLGSALGAAAGVMNGFNYLTIRFDMGWTMAIKGFTSAVMGGLGNVYGAMLGGYFLAFLEVAIVALIPQGSQYKDVIAFLILIMVLVFRPSGILKKTSGKMG